MKISDSFNAALTQLDATVKKVTGADAFTKNMKIDTDEDRMKAAEAAKEAAGKLDEMA